MWVWTGRIISRRGSSWWGWVNENEKDSAACMVFHAGISGVENVVAGAALVMMVEKIDNPLYNSKK